MLSPDQLEKLFRTYAAPDTSCMQDNQPVMTYEGWLAGLVEAAQVLKRPDQVGKGRRRVAQGVEACACLQSVFEKGQMKAKTKCVVNHPGLYLQHGELSMACTLEVVSPGLKLVAAAQLLKRPD